MRTAFSLGQAAEIFLRTRTELADQLVRISATCPPPPFLYATSAMPRARRSRRALTDPVPNRLDPPILSAETAVLDEFNEKLNEPDERLTSLDDEAYKAWLRVMFAGLAGLVQKRYAALTANRKARFEQWRKDWEPQVDMVSPVQYVDRNKIFLRTKSNFAYLAEGLQSSKDWYLVNTSFVNFLTQKNRNRLADQESPACARGHPVL